MKSEKATLVRLELDASSLYFYLHVLKRIFKRPLDIGLTLAELVRIEVDSLAAGAGVVAVRFYPSDRLLDFVAALWTREREGRVVKKASHKKRPFNQAT